MSLYGGGGGVRSWRVCGREMCARGGCGPWGVRSGYWGGGGEEEEEWVCSVCVGCSLFALWVQGVVV